MRLRVMTGVTAGHAMASSQVIAVLLRSWRVLGVIVRIGGGVSGSIARSGPCQFGHVIAYGERYLGQAFDGLEVAAFFRIAE
jgi:hypothetical protein